MHWKKPLAKGVEVRQNSNYFNILKCFGFPRCAYYDAGRLTRPPEYRKNSTKGLDLPSSKCCTLFRGIRRWQQASSGSCPLCLHLSIWKLSKVNCNKSCSGVLFIRMACLDQWDVQQLIQLIDLQHLAVPCTINSCIWKEVFVELTQLILKFTISKLKYLQATLIMSYDISVLPRSRVWTFSVEGFGWTFGISQGIWTQRRCCEKCWAMCPGHHVVWQPHVTVRPWHPVSKFGAQMQCIYRENKWREWRDTPRLTFDRHVAPGDCLPAIQKLQRLGSHEIWDLMMSTFLTVLETMERWKHGLPLAWNVCG